MRALGGDYMAVHMTYKPASAARVTRKKVATKATSSVSSIAAPFACKMVELVEAPDEDAALNIAKPPKGCVPTVFKLEKPIDGDGTGMHGIDHGKIPDNLFVLIYP